MIQYYTKCSGNGVQHIFEEVWEGDSMGSDGITVFNWSIVT